MLLSIIDLKLIYLNNIDNNYEFWSLNNRKWIETKLANQIYSLFIKYFK